MYGKHVMRERFRRALQLLGCPESHDSDSDPDWECILSEAVRSLEEDQEPSPSNDVFLEEGDHIHMEAEPMDPTSPHELSNHCSTVTCDAPSHALDSQRSALRSCIQCGAEVLLPPPPNHEFNLLFRCELVGRVCDEIDWSGDREMFLHCCALCGTSHVLAIDLATSGHHDFVCSSVGCKCAELVDRSDNICLNVDKDTQYALQCCSICGAEYKTNLDIARLGIDFQCFLMGVECWLNSEDIGKVKLSGHDEDFDTREGKTLAISAIESQRLLARLGKPFSPKRGCHDLMDCLNSNPCEMQHRYRNNVVVTTKGERWISVDSSRASSYSGTEIAGIIGAGSRGRLGLGLRKMTKETAERFSLSNRERGHVKKKVAHARNEREVVVFEGKSNMHQLVHAAVLPSSLVKPGR